MDSKTFCVLPWVHSCTRPNETFRPCCRFRGDLDFTLDDVQSKGIEAMNSERANSIRSKMLKGERVEGCETCYKEEDSPNRVKPSMRLFLNKRFGHAVKDRVLDNKYLKTHYMEIALDNICNLECRMCTSFFSTKLRKRDQYLNNMGLGYDVHKKQEGSWHKYNSTDLSSLSYVKVLGGEVFKTPNFQPFLEWLDEKAGLENISMEVATNGTGLPSPRVSDMLYKLKHFNINLSLDAAHPVNDYQRQGSHWQTTINNGKLLEKMFSKNVYFSVHLSESILTVAHLSTTLHTLDKLGWGYTVGWVHQPYELDPLHCPDSVKQWIFDSNRDHTKALDIVTNHFKTHKYNKRVWEDLDNHVTLLDDYYNVKLADYDPTLAQHLGV